MFQFTGFPPYDYGFIIRCMRSSHAGFPIRISADYRVFAPPRGFSQLVTSFFGSWCRGIRPVPFSLNRLLAHIALCAPAFLSVLLLLLFLLLIDLFCLYPANLIFHKACAFSRFSVFKVRPGSSKASDRISGNRTPSLTVSVLFVFYKKVRQPPAFPGRRRPSIIGRKGLYLSVRDGYGCFPLTHRHRTFFLSSLE